jgi:hypothetical protein
MKINKPVITKDNRRCVYMMQFPDHSFYIGSTVDLKRRIGGYLSAFKNSIGHVNKLIAAKVEKFDEVWFKILLVVPEDEETRTHEHKFIQQYIGHPLFLNRSKSAFNNSGMIKARQ